MLRRLVLVVFVPSAACSDREPRALDSANVAPVDSLTKSIMAEPLRALGTEPFWALDISASGLKFTTPEDTSGVRYRAPAPTIEGDAVVWSGQSESATIEARVWPQKCSDGMSDREYPYTARVTIGRTEYRGCANHLRVLIEGRRP